MRYPYGRTTRKHNASGALTGRRHKRLWKFNPCLWVGSMCILRGNTFFTSASALMVHSPRTGYSDITISSETIPFLLGWRSSHCWIVFWLASCERKKMAIEVVILWIHNSQRHQRARWKGQIFPLTCTCTCTVDIDQYLIAFTTCFPSVSALCGHNGCELWPTVQTPSSETFFFFFFNLCIIRLSNRNPSNKLHIMSCDIWPLPFDLWTPDRNLTCISMLMSCKPNMIKSVEWRWSVAGLVKQLL